MRCTRRRTHQRHPPPGKPTRIPRHFAGFRAPRTLRQRRMLCVYGGRLQVWQSHGLWASRFYRRRRRRRASSAGGATARESTRRPLRPAQWAQTSTALQGLRCSARKPVTDQAGRPLPDGVIHEWLVLGPVPFSDDGTFNKDTLPGEAELAPDEGQQTGGLAWKKATLDSSYLDFAKLIGKPGTPWPMPAPTSTPRHPGPSA